MLPNFESHTKDLNSEDKKAVPFLQRILETKTIDNPIVSYLLIEETNMLLKQVKLKPINDVKLRKLVNYMRTHDILPICSTSNGYFVSYDEKVLQLQIVSLSKRGNAILSCAYGLERFIKI